MSVTATEFIYGIHTVQALLMRDPVRVVRLFVIRARDDVRVSALLEAAAKVACPVDRIEAVRLERMVGAVVHQGVVAEVRPLAPWNEDQLANALANPLPSAGPPLLLVLDGVQDPHNLGACLRTADACGALAVITPKDRAVQLNATVRKVAAGAADTTPVVAVTNLARCLRDLKDAGLWIIGAEASAAKRADQVDLKGPTALVLGAEGSGLRQLTRQHCDLLVTLPALGAVESLNVSVAAGMLLYEALRQRYS